MRRAARVCSAPGCGAITQGSRCPAHEVTQSQRRGKDPEQAKHYRSRRWRLISELVRRQEPVCRMCRVTPSASVHHLDSDWRNCARENLAALCGPCHAAQSGRDHRAKR